MTAPQRIVIDSAVCHGKPVIRGTRVPVTVVVGSLAAGMSFEAVQREYDLTSDDIRAALRFVGQLAEQESFHPLPAVQAAVRFLVDANLPRSLAALLSAAGHEVEFARDIGLAAARDEQVAVHARATCAVLVTRDLDFSDVRQYPPREYFGIVVLRMPDDALAADIVKIVDLFIRDGLFLNSLVGRLAIVEVDRVRFRPP